MLATHKVKEITFDQSFIYLKIDGKEFKIQTNKVSKKLSEAKEFQRNLFTISPSGYGIHWPLIDEDLSIDSLIKVAQS
jgi:hypothetical protein